VLEEVRDVALRPKIVSRFGITLTGLEAFLAHILAISECLEDVPTEFHYDGDHDDAHYVNLAIAAHASLIVSRDHDLLVLGDSATPEGADFRTRYPGIEIIPPVELLTRLDAK
jgi:putative PIN family toxin of toxin-antitoxin system